MKKNLLILAAAAEAATGVVAVAAPSTVTRALFGSEVAGTGALMSRIAGIALIALGLACWPGSGADGRQATRGMLLYSALATIYLTVVAISGATVGPLLWPAAVLHFLLTALLARALLTGAGARTPTRP